MSALVQRVRSWSARRIIIVATALVLVVAAVVWLVWIRPSSGATAAPTARTITATAATATFDKSVSTSGTLTPGVNDSVAFEASGTVTAVKVAEGDTVKKNQVLATIDTLQLDSARLSARADLLDAKAELSEAKTDSDGSSAALARIEAREAAVEVAQQTYDDAKSAMDDATLRAPDAGIITAVNVAVGDVVSGGSSSSSNSSDSAPSGSTGSTQGSGSASTSTSSTTAFTIVGTEDWTMSASVSESDISNLQVGNQVELTVDGVSDTVYGVVTTIGKLPSTSSSTVTYPVTITVTGDPEGLYDGVSADASIIYERRTGVLAIPAAAVTTTDGTSTVEVEGADGATSTVTVELGETNGDQVEITSGLSEGDTVSYSFSTGAAQGSGTSGGGNSGSDGAGFPGGTDGGFSGGDSQGGPPDGGGFSGGGDAQNGSFGGDR